MVADEDIVIDVKGLVRKYRSSAGLFHQKKKETVAVDHIDLEVRRGELFGLLVCGVNFPVSYLPIYIQPISYVIPMTYGTEAARLAVSGASLREMSGPLGLEILVGLAVMFVGYLMFRGFERLARSRGTLDQF